MIIEGELCDKQGVPFPVRRIEDVVPGSQIYELVTGDPAEGGSLFEDQLDSLARQTPSHEKTKAHLKLEEKLRLPQKKENNIPTPDAGGLSRCGAHYLSIPSRSDAQFWCMEYDSWSV